MNAPQHRQQFFSTNFTRWLTALLLATWCATARAETATNAPKLHFDRTLYSFGITSDVQSVSGTFTFQNTGTGVLKIDKPAPSCGCTVAEVKPTTLEPGEKGELVFKVSLVGSKGFIDKHITVPSNDPVSPKIYLTIQANIRPTYMAFPSEIQLGDFHDGETTNILVQLRRVDGHKLVVTNSDCSLADCHLKFIPVDHPADPTDQIMVTIRGGGKPGPFTGLIRIYTDHPDRPEFRLGVFGNLVGDVMVAPGTLNWMVWNTGHWPGPNTVSMLVKTAAVSFVRSDYPLVISNFTSFTRELKVTAEPVAPITHVLDAAQGISGAIPSALKYHLIVQLTNAPTKSTSGTITFDTNAEKMPHVTVPVVVQVSIQKQ